LNPKSHKNRRIEDENYLPAGKSQDERKQPERLWLKPPVEFGKYCSVASPKSKASGFSS
jgi:hypothetical protein